MDEIISELLSLRDAGVEGEIYPVVKFRPIFSDITQQNYISDVTYDGEIDNVIITLK